jgi:hypothetical protein
MLIPGRSPLVEVARGVFINPRHVTMVQLSESTVSAGMVRVEAWNHDGSRLGTIAHPLPDVPVDSLGRTCGSLPSVAAPAGGGFVCEPKTTAADPVLEALKDHLVNRAGDVLGKLAAALPTPEPVLAPIDLSQVAREAKPAPADEPYPADDRPVTPVEPMPRKYHK